MIKKFTALSFWQSGARVYHQAPDVWPAAFSLLLAASGLLLACAAWAAGPEDAGLAATQQVTGVACGVIGLVQGVVGKMLAFIFLAAGAVAAFAGKWAYVAGGIGGGLLLIVGPKILATAFETAQNCPP